MLCHLCDIDPCQTIVYGDLLHELSSTDVAVNPNVAHRKLYPLYVLSVYGYLGSHNRVQIPSCVLDFIHEIHPDPNGEYMGHKAVEDE